MVLSNDDTNNLRNFVRIVLRVTIPVLGILLVIITFFSTISPLTFASDNSTIMRSPTNGSSLEVILAPLESSPDNEMQFRVGFLQPKMNQLQEHVDFNFIIIKDGKEVFSASNQTGQPDIPLHSIPGIMDIPLFTYDFQKKGEYIIKIPVFGILFNPIKPEEAEFRTRY